MSELPGTAAVGIESVEWLDAGGGNLTVQVSGRWRRRRPAVSGPTMLIIEADGRRHRFPAMPEPPSLVGASPGTWRLSFAVPAELAPELRGHTWLSLGTVTVPLPVPESATPPAADPEQAPASLAPPEPAGVARSEPAEPAEPEPTRPESTERAPRPSTGGLEIERAWRRADDAERAMAQQAERVAQLERALEDQRREREQAVNALADHERNRRAAEQRAYAEEAMRRDLARQLAGGAAETARARRALGDLAAAEDRIRELERALGDARRAGDEAERAAAALAARDRAAHSPWAQAAFEGGPEAAQLRAEDALRARHETAGSRVPAEPAARADPPVTAGAQAATGSGTIAAAGSGPMHPADVATALRRELSARVATEAGLRARVVAAETRLAARVLLEQRTTATLHELRAELENLRDALGSERERRAAAEAQAAQLREELAGQRDRSEDAYDAIGELRGALDELAPRGGVRTGEPSPPADPSPAPVVTPERLSDALARLRESTAPRDAIVEPPAAAQPMASPSAAAAVRGPGPLSVLGRPTVERPFRRLVAHDAALAGQLLLDLLPAQRAAYPHPVAYDLVLGPGRGCVQVTVGAGAPEVKLDGAARAREQVDFQIVGDPARLARLLTASPLRRLLRVGIAQVRGRREGVAAVRALLALSLDLNGLHAAGLRLAPETLLGLVAAMIDPVWTRGERFTIAHADERGGVVYLQVRDGRAPLVTRSAPEGRVATTLTGSAGALAVALTRPTEPREQPAQMTGDAGPLRLLCDWIDRAQCG